MAMNLVDLDDTTRQHMRTEVELDIATTNLYLSTRLTPQGIAQYPNLIREAVATGTILSFIAALSGHIRVIESYTDRYGVRRERRVPVTAAETLGEGEFNRFYVRAVCIRAIGEGGGQVQVYRAKPVSDPRPESQRLIGTLVDAQRLLEDLRSNTGLDTALGIPAGPNSGISVHLPTTS